MQIKLPAEPSFLTIFFSVFFIISLSGQSPEEIKLRDFRPRSIYKVPETRPQQARYPAIDMHSHPYARTAGEVDEWVRRMEALNVEKTIILTYSVGASFDSLLEVYGRYPDQFELWCGFDFREVDQPGWTEKAVAELERCYRAGARGVGEIHDKGTGLRSGRMPGGGLRIDDAKMKPLLEKCAELGMPLNIHIAEPMWMYESMDETNDGLMNAYKWRIDKSQPNLLDHGELIEGFERAVRDNPRTTFICCHMLNCSHDLSILGDLFDKYPNLYADVSARYAEMAGIPRFVKSFIEKYQDRVVYGTDMGMSEDMYRTTFRILETTDEHFYDWDRFSYHWPLYGFGLNDETLKKVYNENPKRVRGER